MDHERTGGSVRDISFVLPSSEEFLDVSKPVLSITNHDLNIHPDRCCDWCGDHLSKTGPHRAVRLLAHCCPNYSSHYYGFVCLEDYFVYFDDCPYCSQILINNLFSARQKYDAKAQANIRAPWNEIYAENHVRGDDITLYGDVIFSVDKSITKQGLLYIAKRVADQVVKGEIKTKVPGELQKYDAMSNFTWLRDEPEFPPTATARVAEIGNLMLFIRSLPALQKETGFVFPDNVLRGFVPLLWDVLPMLPYTK